MMTVSDLYFFFVGVDDTNYFGVFLYHFENIVYYKLKYIPE